MRLAASRFGSSTLPVLGFVLGLVLFHPSDALSAQVLTVGEYRHELAPTATAVRILESPSIDGMLDEAFWADIPPITELLQTAPFEGAPVSERTEVRVAYDGDAIYVGARLDDRHPPTTRLARRDAGLGDSDTFVLLLDSFHDHETAYRFWTNPSGVKGDAIVTGNSTGSGDSSWDPVWEVGSQITPSGWTVEMRIPFSQLRFSREDIQVWGIQVERRIHRNQEFASFPFTPVLDRGGVARFAHLEGIRGIDPGGRLEMLPYIAARGEYLRMADAPDAGFRNPFRSGSDHFGDVGLDLKYRLTSNVTLDATVNPDFGQVELDPSEINLTAFETRFSERRPFFVEGADIFSFGEAGPGGSVGRGPDLVYSRRIGAAPRGSVPSGAVYSERPAQTTILGAAKVTGRLGGGWSVGILEAVTSRETASYVATDAESHRVTVEPVANYFVARARRQIRGGLTRFGAIGSTVTRRSDGTPLSDQLHSSAFSGGVDFAHESADRVWLFTALASGSHVRGDPLAIESTQRSSRRYFQRPDADHLELDPAAHSLSGFYVMGFVGKQAGRLTTRTALAAVSPGYEVNDVGFHNNADRIILDTHFQWNVREPGRIFRSWSAFGGPDAVWNFAGDQTLANLNTQLNLELLNYWRGSIRTQWDPWTDDDRLTRGGPIARTPARFDVRVNLNSDGRRTAVAGLNLNSNRDDGGSWSRSGSVNLNVRVAETFQLRFGPSISRSHSEAQYLTRIVDPLADRTHGVRYVFAELDRTTVSFETNLNLTLSPTLSLQLYAEPFISTGDYGSPREFRAPGTFEFLEYGREIGTVVPDGPGALRIDPDGDGPAPSFRITDRDFSVRSLLGNAVFRWEWRPGSTLFLVWQQRRLDSVVGQGSGEGMDWVGRFDLSRDLGDLFSAPSENILMIKMNYWLNP